MKVKVTGSKWSKVRIDVGIMVLPFPYTFVRHQLFHDMKQYLEVNIRLRVFFPPDMAVYRKHLHKPFINIPNNSDFLLLVKHISVWLDYLLRNIPCRRPEQATGEIHVQHCPCTHYHGYSWINFVHNNNR